MNTAARLSALLRRYNPTYLGFLGLLAVPGYFVESLWVLEIFEIFFIAFLWMFVGPLVHAVLGRWSDEADEDGPRDWLAMGSWREYALFFLSLPLVYLNPLTVVQGDLLQTIGILVSYVRYGGSVPDAKSYDQRVSYRLPFEGTWTVVNGSPDREFSHSWFLVNQRYAYDFVVTDDDGRTRPEDSASAVENYYCYGEPILTPAAGVVVDTLDTDLELGRGGGLSHPLKRTITGNYVVIQHAPDEYSCLAHLQPGSVAVEPGERVDRGQQVARCGHSGNSSEPHLHFQVQDHPAFEIAASLPVRFADVEIDAPVEAARPKPSHVGDAGAGLETARPDEPHESSDKAVGETNRVADAATQWFPLAAVSVGQRVRHASQLDGEIGEAVASRPALVQTSGATRGAFARRLGIGLVVGGVIAFVADILTSWIPATIAIAAGVVLGTTLRVWYPLVSDVDLGTRRPGALGMPIGLGVAGAGVGLVGATSPGIGLGTTSGLLLLAGTVVTIAGGEYARVIRQNPDRNPESSRS